MNDNAVNYEIEYSKDSNDSYPLYLVFNDVDVHFLCTDGEKCLVFASTDKNEEVQKNYKKLWDEVKEELRTMKGGIKELYPQIHLNNCCLEYDDHDVCCKITLKYMNNSEYGKYLFKKMHN